MNRWGYGKRGITSIEIILLVIMICVLIATGILIHNKYQQEKVINAIRDVVGTETETKQNIENYNANKIVEANCYTIQTLIIAELADSDYKTLKNQLTTRGGDIFFWEADIQVPGDGLQARNGNNQSGWVVVSFDDSLERFLINGNALDGGNVLNQPLVAKKYKKF